MDDVNPSNQTLLTLIGAGASDGEFIAAARAAMAKQAGFGYALTVVANERKRAAGLSEQIHRGSMPAKQPTETAHARKMRETVEGLAPGVARRSTGLTPPAEIIEMENRHVNLIEGH